jgi:hypothetical protein
MAWEERFGRRYFYRSKRDGNTVKKVYLGCQAVAKQAAEKDATAKAKQAAQNVELAELEAKLASVDQLAAEAQQGVDILTEGTLLALEFHEHRGTWRKHRNDHRT